MFSLLINTIKLSITLNFLLLVLYFNIKPSFCKQFTLPDVKYDDLLTLEKSTSVSTVEILTSIGALQITQIPRFSLARKRALEDLATCLVDERSIPELVMADGSRRLSCGALSIHGKSSEMSSLCGEAANRLQSIVDATTRQFFLALDSILVNQSNHLLMKPSYHTFNDLMYEGQHIEHLHAYYGPSTPSHAKVEPTLDFHIDGGLMIAMTTGYYSDQNKVSAASGLYIKLGNGDKVQVKANDDGLIIMMGQGANQWLDTKGLHLPQGRSFHAPLHALYADLNEDVTRSWYGKMYLPPQDAVIPTEDITFNEYSKISSMHSRPLVATASTASSLVMNDLLPSACSSKSLLKFQSRNIDGKSYVSTMENSCPTGQLWCWARCMDSSSLSCSVSDQVCMDYRSDTEMPSSDSMCMGGDDATTGGVFCGPGCLATTVTNSSSDEKFCYGEGTTMFMQGFVALTPPSSQPVQCVNLLFESWTLNSEVKFAIACVGIFFLSLLVQAVPLARRFILTDDHKFPFISSKIGKDILVTMLFGIDKVISYFLMLVAMTYSVELFCMICVGMTSGYWLFAIYWPRSSNTENVTLIHKVRGKSNEYTGRWGDICCEDTEKGNEVRMPLRGEQGKTEIN